MIETVYGNTLEFIKNVPKESRKSIGQFFTQPSIAKFMSTLINSNKENIKILDAGAGSGILATSLCENYLECNFVKNIHIDLYENDKNILPVLKENMEYVKKFMKTNGKKFSYNIVEENFILFNKNVWNSKEKGKDYDIVISNPPYKKIGKSDNEALAMRDIVYGQPNIYFLFMAMAAKLLKVDGQLVFITPRSFTSGAYFKEFRKWFLDNIKLTNIHLFNSRNDVFTVDSILQETIILKAVKTNNHIDNITITTSTNADFNDVEKLEVPTDKIVNNNCNNKYILIPSNREELEIIKLINSWKHTMLELGFRISTGKVVCFRAKEFIKESQDHSTVPLIWASHFINNNITHPINDKKCTQYIISNEVSTSILNDNKNYLLIKRLTSKEEFKRIQVAIYLKDKFENYDRIGIENHINYISGDLTLEELYGLFAIFNSTYIDKYYRILNGSTQVNATELNSIPLPDIEIIRVIGDKLLREADLSVKKCDNLIKNFLTY